MSYTLHEHGDYIEKINAAFIEEKLPSYIAIWSIYIGNDGEAQAPIIAGISLDHQKLRSKFSEAHYTCLESLLCMKRIEEKARYISTTPSYEVYLDFISDFMAFHAHTGRVRDSIREMIKLFISKPKKKNSSDLLEQFWAARNNTLHRSKLPYSLVGGAFIIMEPTEARMEMDQYYNKKNISTQPWGYSETSPALFKEVKGYYIDFLEDLLKQTERILKEISVEIVIFLKSNNYNLPAPAKQFSSTTSSAAVLQQNGSGSATSSDFERGIKSGSIK